ncbi:MAG: YgjP-like metallopeptidase domain-containing protein [Erysipelothrix sp.]
MKIEIIKSDRKTLAIQVRDGRAYVRAPYNMDDQIIQNFIDEKFDWIAKNINRYEKLNFEFNDESLRIFGDLKKVEYIPSVRLSLEERENQLIIYYPENISNQKIEKYVETYFKNQLIKKLDYLLVKYSLLLHLDVPEYKVRKYKRLHGRCSANHELAFNTYLYHESAEFIEYVVLHECAHRIEFNHSHRFYAIIEKHMPDYKQRIKQQRNQNL